MLRLNSFLIFALSLSLQISCASVPDVPVCTEIHMSKGFCTHTISNKEEFIEGDAWWNIRYKMILLPPDSWAKIKAFVIKTCKKTGQCDNGIADWERTVNTIDQKIIKE